MEATELTADGRGVLSFSTVGGRRYFVAFPKLVRRDKAEPWEFLYEEGASSKAIRGLGHGSRLRVKIGSAILYGRVDYGRLRDSAGRPPGWDVRMWLFTPDDHPDNPMPLEALRGFEAW